MASERSADAVKAPAEAKRPLMRLPPVGFWSYSRQDDELSFGKLSQLRKLLMAEVQQQFGRERVQIFQDAETISHGAEWEGEIRQSLDNSTFFIPIITPNFVQSEWCSKEVSLFFEREQALFRDYPDLPRRSRIFPLLLIDIDDVDPHDEGIMAALQKRQMFDYRPHRFRSLQDEQVQQALSSFAGAIRELLQIKVRKPLSPAELAQAEADERRRQEDAAAEAARIEEERRLREAEAAEAARLEDEERRRSEAEAAEAARLEAERRRREAEAAETKRREDEARRQQEGEAAEAARVEEAHRLQAIAAAEAATRRAAEHLAERERAAAFAAARPVAVAVAPEGAGWTSRDGLPPPDQELKRARSTYLWLALVGIALLLAAILLPPVLLGRGGEEPRNAPAQVAASAAPAKAPPGPAAPAAPQHAWLYGTWCLVDDPSVVRTISGGARSITLAFGGNRQTENVLSATADRVLTNVAEYLRTGATLRVTEPDAQFRYQMRRCGTRAE